VKTIRVLPLLLLLSACDATAPPASDAGSGDAGTDSAVPERDAGGSDSGASDAGAPDAGAADGGLGDGGLGDGGLGDGGAADASPSDAGSADAAIGDAGVPEVFALVTDTDRTFIGNTLRGSTWDRPGSASDTCPASSQPTIGMGTRYETYRFRNEDAVTLIVAFDLNAGYDPHLTAYAGLDFPPDLLQCVAIDDDISMTNRNASLLFTMMPGETVLVVLSGHAAADAGPYTFVAQAVPL